MEGGGPGLGDLSLTASSVQASTQCLQRAPGHPEAQGPQPFLWPFGHWSLEAGTTDPNCVCLYQWSGDGHKKLLANFLVASTAPVWVCSSFSMLNSFCLKYQESSGLSNWMLTDIGI